MSPLDISLYTLLGTSLVFAIIELGLSAYVVSLYSNDTVCFTYYGCVKVYTPAVVSFTIFSSLWTMLVSAGSGFVSFFFGRRNPTASFSKLISIILLVVYFVTMVFWLAAFADIASLLGGFTSNSDYLNAIIAFAVLLWLLFLALFILGILAAVDVLQSDLFGYQSLKTKATTPAAGNETTEIGLNSTIIPVSEQHPSPPVAQRLELSEA